MPNTSSAKKELRVAERRHMRNKSVKSETKSKITKAEKLIVAGDLEAAKSAVGSAVRTLDKAAEKGILHRNAAARRKSRLVLKLNKAVPATKAEETKEEAKK